MKAKVGQEQTILQMPIADGLNLCWGVVFCFVIDGLSALRRKREGTRARGTKGFCSCFGQG